MSFNHSHKNFDEQGLNITPVSSLDEFQTENHDINLGIHGSFYREINSLDIDNNTNEIVPVEAISAAGYNSNNGFGLVNAKDAVNRVVGNQNTFTEVPDTGGNNWGADLIKAPEVWNQGYTGKNIIVAVLDTGVDYNHSDLNDNIWNNSQEIAGNGKDDDGNGYIDDVFGWNFDSNNNNVLDGNGHGTHVAGTIAAENNGFGVTGIAYDAKIMPIKILNDSGSGYYNSIIKGVYYAVDNGADVINLSVAGAADNTNLQKAIEYASSKGVIVVMAAGNDGDPQPHYPARYAKNWGIAVGAVDKNNNMADFSNRAGSNLLPYVTAPGKKVYSTVSGNDYAYYNGTSMAAPHVAGVVALMLSANPELTDAQVRKIITETAKNAPKSESSNGNFFNSLFKNGFINYSFNSFTASSVKNTDFFGTNANTTGDSNNVSSINVSSSSQELVENVENQDRFFNPESGSSLSYWQNSVNYDSNISLDLNNGNENNNGSNSFFDFGNILDFLSPYIPLLLSFFS
ncbi:MAG: S8 family peptidase [Nostocaceae cyanobacterium]|nr:S8 family peptidase [Nostocaceae cyanobacterium]